VPDDFDDDVWTRTRWLSSDSESANYERRRWPARRRHGLCIRATLKVEPAAAATFLPLGAEELETMEMVRKYHFVQQKSPPRV